MAVNFQNANNQTITPTEGQEYVFTVEGLKALAANTLSVVGTQQADNSTPPLIVYIADSQLGSAIIPNAVRRPSQDNLRYVKLLKGDGTQCFLEVGNDIVVPTNTENANSPYGTTPVKINGIVVDFPIKGLSSITTNNVTTTYIGSSGLPWTNGYITNLYGTGNVGSTSSPYANGYFTNLYGTGNVGSTSSPYANGYFTNLTVTNLNLPAGNNDSAFNLKGGTTAQFLRGNGSNKNPIWSNTLEGDLYLAKVTQGIPIMQTQLHNNNNDGTTTQYAKNTDAAIYTIGGICAEKNIWGAKIFNAVFNDYAEYRTTIDLTPGHVVIDQDDGSLACTFTRLQPGAQVISDTFGHAMGQTFDATTPIAVAGRVLVYTYQPRENYHAGMAVCSAPDGTVDIMTREEIRDYPDCIVGIVSEIPEYETWGSDNVKVNGRIWIRVK